MASFYTNILYNILIVVEVVGYLYEVTRLPFVF